MMRRRLLPSHPRDEQPLQSPTGRNTERADLSAATNRSGQSAPISRLLHRGPSRRRCGETMPGTSSQKRRSSLKIPIHDHETKNILTTYFILLLLLISLYLLYSGLF